MSPEPPALAPPTPPSETSGKIKRAPFRRASHEDPRNDDHRHKLWRQTTPPPSRLVKLRGHMEREPLHEGGQRDTGLQSDTKEVRADTVKSRNWSPGHATSNVTPTPAGFFVCLFVSSLSRLLETAAESVDTTPQHSTWIYTARLKTTKLSQSARQ